jgi:S1-C subfamily serine protease
MRAMNEDQHSQPPLDYTAGYANLSAPRNYDVEPTSHIPTEPPPSFRLSKLLWILAFFLIVLIGPYVVERFQYYNTLGKEQAKVDVALAGLSQLGKLNLDGLSEASRLVAQRMGPSVVHIRTVRTINGGRAGGDAIGMFGFPQQQQQAQGEGSGVIVDEAGYLVTNNHVVSGAEQIDVQLADGRQVKGVVVGRDAPTDIAVVKIEAPRLIAAAWGDSSALEVGDLIWAVGSPFGLDRTVTFGIVSAKQRRAVTDTIRYQDFIQTDAAVNPGNSGGPLVNIRGEVVGINTAIVGNSYSGISFAIPSSIAKKMYDLLRSGQAVPRGWLGVQLAELTERRANELELGSMQGVLVERVFPDSPAQQAGLETGDLIQSWNNKKIVDANALSWEVASTKPGTKAIAKILRGGQELSLTVNVVKLPEQFR